MPTSSNPKRQTIEPIWLAREFFHGIADTPIPGVAKSKLWGATDELLCHFPHMGVVLTAVCQLAKLFGCEATLEAVTAERNRRTAAVGLAGYAKMLYEDAGIVCSVMDSNLPIDDPILDLTPGPKLRLLQMDPLLQKLLESSGSYAELLRSFQAAVEKRDPPGRLRGDQVPPGRAGRLRRSRRWRRTRPSGSIPPPRRGTARPSRSSTWPSGWPRCSRPRT